MTRIKRGQMGYDGYRELEAKEERAKVSARTKGYPQAEKAQRDAKELKKLREEHYKKTNRDGRADKYIHPRGSGKRK